MEHECWQNAMQAELQALKENHTWDIVPCPPTVKPIGSKWVFSTKLCYDGSLDRYKARLVALGNKQEYGVDYEETFAPVVKMTTVRTILAIAASQSWQLHQMDVKNASLHSDLQEEICMKLPTGMTMSSPHDVCKLKHSLYGLKQAPWAWFEKFRNTIHSSSLTQSRYDSSLFFHTSLLGIVILLVYVDGIIIIGTNCDLITKLQQLLYTTFHIKDLGQLTYFLGLEVHHRANGIFVNQHKYIQDFITLASLEDTSSVDTPMEVNVKYRKDEGDLLDDPTLYRRLVRSLIYLTTTRPDISYAVHQVSQFYVFSSASPSCCSSKHHPLSSRFTYSWIVLSLHLLPIVMLIGLGVQIHVDLLQELGFPQTTSTPLHADNTSAIPIATNPVFHERTKHIEVDCHSIRDTLESRVISLPHISYDLQVADVFTKALTRQWHQFLVGKLLLVDLPASI
ncbi:Retrovirus-related Pol polyprotein from transposon RE1 [Vitis vinifera]|uniref:Retrovirus-related Pol polyprotein from transposon RE1 n=1 Tax=Vitis vinifera TaxID=29760 RepID=A0A438EA98_VITVI|nr:Retrovirus-related Pol polyprotein from transposon RE1 [Vitis vinifera]